MSKKNLRSWKKVFESDLLYVASELKETLSRPALVMLTGKLGAGKTTFVKKFLQDAQVQSPTYALVTEYGKMVHADFYRIEDVQEIPQLELNLYLQGKDYFLAEWGMKFAKVLSSEIDDEYFFYELDIIINDATDRPSRDYHLYEVDRLQL